MNKILIVEDNTINYKVLFEILSIYNVNLEWAIDGDTFFKIIEKSKNFDLILMDLMLPDTDGIELTKYLIEKSIKIPVVFISAYSERCEEIYDLGVEYFISKPVYKDLFLSIVNKYIELVPKNILTEEV
jgi:putative two-component system response regulator